MLTRAHSWLAQVGSNGVKRGGLFSSDEENERYFCPYANLTKCVAPNSGIVLTESARRPCPQGYSSPMAEVEAGGPLFLGWPGNGHVGAQSKGTCVYVGITPFAKDPEMSSFTTLQECGSFSHGFSTGTNIIIPGTTIAGKYTLFWSWHFAGFWYSSCADIVVQPHTENTPTLPPTIPNSVALKLNYSSVDCAIVSDPDGYCIALFGAISYCKQYAKDACGRAHCQGNAPVVDCVVSGSPSAVPAITLPTVSPAEAVLPYNTTDCKSRSNPDAWCKAMAGAYSYCKSWMVDLCGFSHCFGRDPPVIKSLDKCPGRNLTQIDQTETAPTTSTRDPSRLGCQTAANPDAYCQDHYGSGSYCKTNLTDHCNRSWCFSQTDIPAC